MASHLTSIFTFTYACFMQQNHYRVALGEMSKQHAKAKALAGIYTGKPLNGYVKVEWSEIHQVDEDKRQNILTLFQRAGTTGHSLRELLKEAHYRGLTSSSGRTLSLNSLHLMLTNPFYAGLIRVDELLLPGKHEAIISKDLFEAIQHKLQSRRC